MEERMKETEEVFEIATIENQSEERRLAVFTTSGIDPILERIAHEARKHVPDLSTDKGRKAVASNSYKVSQSKILLGKAGRSLTSDMKDKCKAIDSVISMMEKSCDEIRDEARQPLTDWEDAEKEREAAEKEREAAEKLAAEISMAHGEALTTNDIVDRERELIQKETAMALEEARRFAEVAAAEMEKERIAREEIVRQEAIAAEKLAAGQEKQRIEQEAKEEIEKAKRAKREAEINAEIEKREAKEREERAKIWAEEEKKQAIEAERKRVADEHEAARIKAEKIAANKAHQKKINNAALSALCGIVKEAEAKEIISAIAKGEVPHITINY